MLSVQEEEEEEEEEEVVWWWWRRSLLAVIRSIGSACMHLHTRLFLTHIDRYQNIILAGVRERDQKKAITGARYAGGH